MTRRRGTHVLALGAALLLAAAAARGQAWRGQAGLEVKVSSRKGGDLSGARIELMYRGARDSGGPPAVATDGNGRAVILGLAAGTWQVEVTHPDFMSYVAVVQLDVKEKPAITASFLEATETASTPIQVKLSKGRGPASPPLPPRVAAAKPERPAPPRTEPAPTPAAQPAPEPEAPAVAAPPPAPAPEPIIEPSAPEQPAPETPATAPGPARGDEVPPVPTAEPPVAAQPAPAAPAAESPPAQPPVATETAGEPQAAEPPTTTEPARKAPAPPRPVPPALTPPPIAPSPAERPAAEATPPAPMPEPTAETETAPPPVPAPAVAPTAEAEAPRAAPAGPAPPPAWRAYRLRTCPECRAGEWAVTVAAEMTGSLACGEAAVDAAAAGAAALGGRAELELAGFAGSLDRAVDRVAADAGSEIAARFAAAGADGCRLLGIVLPKRSRFVGFQYEIEGADGRQPCLPDHPCPGGTDFAGPPRIARGAAATVVHALAHGGRGLALLTVYFRAPDDEWAPDR